MQIIIIILKNNNNKNIVHSQGFRNWGDKGGSSVLRIPLGW